MSFFFFKKQSYYYAIKLFRITDIDSADEFPIQKIILELIDELKSLTNLSANFFDINYKKKSSKSFIKELQKNEVTYCFVGLGKENDNCYFTINNPMINYIKKPKKSLLDIYIQLDEKHYSEKIIKLCSLLINNFDFEYGYIQRFSKNVDGSTERIIKKGFFSSSIDVTIDDINWRFHSVAINYGYIKKLYNYNFLNLSQLENPLLKEQIEKTGTYTIISSNIILWKIDNAEINKLIKNICIKKFIVDLPIKENIFLKTEKAKEFNEMMALEK